MVSVVRFSCLSAVLDRMGVPSQPGQLQSIKTYNTYRLLHMYIVTF
jgi:hypothetical protein